MKPCDVLLIEPRAITQPRGGVARYIRQIAWGLHARHDAAFAICSSLNGLPPARRIQLPLRYPWRYSSPFGYHLTDMWERKLLHLAERWLKPKVVFSPFFGPLSTQTTQVFTVYDLRWQLFPDSYSSKAFVLEKRHMSRCFEHAAAIISISEATKRDLLAIYPQLRPEKVHVILLGVASVFYSPQPLQWRKPYFLYVGNRSEPKNFARLVHAFSKSGLSGDFDLLVISPELESRHGFNFDERQLIADVQLTDSIVLRVGVHDNELAAAYAGATAFVFPSMYEGFGLPALEALAAGTIVACSRASSLPEAGGESAFYFNPIDVDDIARTMIETTRLSTSERTARIADGGVHARNHSWDVCVAKTCQLLEDVARS